VCSVFCVRGVRVCSCVCVFACLCVRVRSRVRVFVFFFVCPLGFFSACVQKCFFLCVFCGRGVRVCSCVFVCVRVCSCVCVFTCLCVCVFFLCSVFRVREHSEMFFFFFWNFLSNSG